jgi:hypothetical protein
MRVHEVLGKGQLCIKGLPAHMAYRDLWIPSLFVSRGHRVSFLIHLRTGPRGSLPDSSILHPDASTGKLLMRFLGDTSVRRF